MTAAVPFWKLWLGFFLSVNLSAYSVLTHEAIVDAAWNRDLKPLLVARYPALTPDQLTRLHAFAYGGAIIQDFGYYPFGSHLFSDITHYVRSADFVQSLLSQAQTPDEYAFALGALAHYSADTQGHSIAINHVVPLLYPELHRKFGNIVTYADNSEAHMKVEFGFDVVQVARGQYAPQAYHDFIGFEVAKPVLERAFLETYGIELSSLFTSLDLALGTYRHTAGSLIPEMTRVAWQTKKDEIQRLVPGITARQFRYRMSRASYEKEWGSRYQKPGVFARILAFLFRLIPRVGPLRALSFRLPTPEAERLFALSLQHTLEQYRANLRAVRAGRLKLPNSDLDTGQPSKAGEYRLADRAYAELLLRFAGGKTSAMPDALRRCVLEFYGAGRPGRPPHVKKKEWRDVMAVLAALRETRVTTSH